MKGKIIFLLLLISICACSNNSKQKETINLNSEIEKLVQTKEEIEKDTNKKEEEKQVQEKKDENLIKEISKKTNKIEKKKKAILEINNLEKLHFLYSIEEDIDIKELIIENIEDEEFLFSIFTIEKNTTLKIKIINKINSIDLLKSMTILENSYIVKEEIIKKIDDENDLLKLYEQIDSIELKKDIINKLNNNRILSYLLENTNENEDLNQYILSKLMKKIDSIEDNIILALIAKNSLNEADGIDVLDRITEEKNFALVVIKGRNLKIREYAFNKILDEKYFIYIMKSEDDMFKERALYKITNVRLLFDVIIDSWIDKNSLAISALKIIDNDKEYLELLEIINKDIYFKDKDDKLNLQTRIVKLIKSKEILLNLATYSSNIEIRKNSIARINDVEFLLDIIYNENNDELKLVALKNIKDHNLIIEIFETIKDEVDNKFIRAAIISKLESKSVLFDYETKVKDELLHDIILLKIILLNEEIIKQYGKLNLYIKGKFKIEYNQDNTPLTVEEIDITITDEGENIFYVNNFVGDINSFQLEDYSSKESFIVKAKIDFEDVIKDLIKTLDEESINRILNSDNEFLKKLVIKIKK